MSPKYLETAIIDRISKGKISKAIILVHLYGMPAKIDEIIKLSNAYDIPIIEDAAEALGSTYKGKNVEHLGSLGYYPLMAIKLSPHLVVGRLFAKAWALKKSQYFMQRKLETVHLITNIQR